MDGISQDAQDAVEGRKPRSRAPGAEHKRASGSPELQRRFRSPRSGSEAGRVSAKTKLAPPPIDHHDGQYAETDFPADAGRAGSRLADAIMRHAPMAAMVAGAVAVSLLFAYVALAASGAAR